jgi:hypothetical protein
MLPVERRHYFSGIKVFEGKHVRFRKAKLIFHPAGYGHDSGFVDAAAQNRRDFNFDLGSIVGAHNQLGNFGLCAWGGFRDMGAAVGLPNTLSDAFQRGIDF